jgi:hypothetical protein
MTNISQPKNESEFSNKLMTPVSRKKFLKFAGATAAASGLILIGCSKSNDAGPTSFDLGSGDTGILNYAYLLEQLEAAFYTQVIASPYASITSDETTMLTDIKEHELAHRDFFKKALSSSAIGSATFDFSSIDFTSRASVLGAAMIFEDLGVAAYNGAGKLITNGDYLVAAGKIVSVEARHASAIRDLLNPFSASFAGDDVITTDNGLDRAMAPADVLAAAGKYVKGTVNFANLPS